MTRLCKKLRLTRTVRYRGVRMSDAKTLNEIRKIGINALTKALDPIGVVRFIQSFDLEKGDYTKERSQWLKQSIDEIVARLRSEG
jgi:hypothetical protein